MKRLVRYFFAPPARGTGSIFWIRLAVGLIFFTQGILKYTDSNMGGIRFTRIGFPHPLFTAHLVGAFEILCGALVLAGWMTRWAVIPLLIIISTAIVTTKMPELFRPAQGFWFMVSDVRADFAMLCSLLFLLLAGPGTISVDQRRALAHRASSPVAMAAESFPAGRRSQAEGPGNSEGRPAIGK